MTKEYRISTIADVAALTEDQQARFFVDFAAWLKFVREFDENAPEQLRGSLIRDRMTWVDDCDQGEISGFDLKVRIQKGGAHG